jgi:hypothetical protein
MLNISGVVNDDLLINGQSVTTDLELDPGLTEIAFGPLAGEIRPYPDTLGCLGYSSPIPNEPAPCCVGAHTIGSVEGPYQDATNGGITFPWNEREFTVACRDTVGFGASIDITICIDPDGEQENHGAPEITRKGRVAPTVTATASGGTGAALSVTLSQQTEAPGGYFCIEAPYWIVESVSVTNGGSGYSPRAVVSFSVSDGGTAEYHAKAYAWVAVEEPRNATVIVHGSGTGAQISASWVELAGLGYGGQPGSVLPPFCGKGQRLVYGVSGFSVSNGGSGYSVGDGVEIEIASSNDGLAVDGVYASVSAVDANGSITAVSIDSGGAFEGSLTDRLGSVIVESCIGGGSGRYYKEDNQENPLP